MTLTAGLAASLGAIAVLASVWPSQPTPAAAAIHRTVGREPTVAGISRAEAERAESRGQLCSSANAVGVGLRGEYFAKAAFGGERLLTRTDATLDLDAGLDWPSGTAGRPRSVRWTGWIKAPLTGRYRFHAEPAGVVVEVSNQRWSGSGSTADTTVELAAGRFYPITVEWPRVDPAAGALRLQWTAPHGARFTIPRNSLYLPTESVAGRG